MGYPLQLSASEQALKSELDALHQRALNWPEMELEERLSLFQEMAQAAHDLHMALKQAGKEPRHNKFLKRNRGHKPTEVEFYNHLHSIDSLYAYLGDTDANTDPVDQTLNMAFEIKIFSRRWGHDDIYRLIRTNTGWQVDHIRGGNSNKRGEPALYDALHGDQINYPHDLPGYLEWLWERASDEGEGLSPEAVQAALNDLAEWISACERSTPRGVFAGYN